MDETEIARSQYADEIQRLRAKNGGNGTVIAKMQNNGSGTKSGPYAWFIAPPSEGREWTYLGPVAADGSGGPVGNMNYDEDESVQIDQLVYGVEFDGNEKESVRLIEDSLGLHPTDRGDDTVVYSDYLDEYVQIDSVSLTSESKSRAVEICVVDGDDEDDRSMKMGIYTDPDRRDDTIVDSVLKRNMSAKLHHIADKGRGGEDADIVVDSISRTDHGKSVRLRDYDDQWLLHHGDQYGVHSTSEGLYVDADSYTDLLEEAADDGLDTADLTDDIDTSHADLVTQWEERTGVDLDGFS